MKIRIFSVLAIICAMVSFNVANADLLSLNPDDGSNPWGTAYSQVDKYGYYHHFTGEGTIDSSNPNYVKARSFSSTATSTSDTWDFRLQVLETYLRDGLATNKMDANTTNASSKYPVNYGLLNDKNNGDDTNSGYQRVYEIPEDSKLTYENVYGKKATTLLGSVVTSGVAEAMLRSDQNGTIYTSFASPINSTVEHNWKYSSTVDSDGNIVENFTSNKTSVSDGIGDQGGGIYAFVSGFNYESGVTYQYINGWFAELGTLVGVYVNGFEITDAFLSLSDNYLNSNYFGNFDVEIDLDALFSAGYVKQGNNNLSFIIDSLRPEFYGGTYYDGNDGLIAFASGLNYNTESIFGGGGGGEGGGGGSQTPEPATLLIFGIGLAGLGIRRKLMSKKSA